MQLLKKGEEKCDNINTSGHCDWHIYKTGYVVGERNNRSTATDTIIRTIKTTVTTGWLQEYTRTITSLFIGNTLRQIRM